MAIAITDKLNNVDKPEIIYLKADTVPKDTEYVFKDSVSDTNFKSVESKEDNLCNETSEVVNEPNIVPEGPVKKLNDSLQFPCSQCGKIFKHETNLKSHLIKHGNKLKCEVCSKEFNRK